MSKGKERRVSFTANKKVSKPVKVNFSTKIGEKVSFTAIKKVSKPVKVSFITKKD